MIWSHMNTFLSSPVWATILAVLGTGIGALIKMTAGMHSKLNSLTTVVSEIAKDVTDIKNDENIMRYSDIARPRVKRRGRDV